MRRTLLGVACALALGLWFNACGGQSCADTGTCPCDPTTCACNPSVCPPPPPGATGVLVGAGDIGQCGLVGSVQTGTLIKSVIAGNPTTTVFAAGDLAYFDGTAAQFRDCYDPGWGSFKARTRPVPGNHEYSGLSPFADPYFDYFGDLAGPRYLGYYAYTVGSWLVIGLNDEIPVNAGSAQEQWLRATLASATNKCVAAIWHKPLYSSGPHGPNAFVKDIWQDLYDHSADLVINGHDHLYEHFSPQDPNGRGDSNRGIVQFTVGTGGAAHYEKVSNSPNSLLVVTGVWGVLKLTLNDGAYTFAFLSAPNGAVLDSGTLLCH